MFYNNNLNNKNLKIVKSHLPLHCKFAHPILEQIFVDHVESHV